jgi:sugar/nucleoside kinase (ribokinase family)
VRSPSPTTGCTASRHCPSTIPTGPLGGGDTFGGALLHARACGWSWERSLELANAATSYYVDHGERAGPGELAAYVGDATIAEFDPG